MKKQVYDYIRNHQHTNLHDIAKTLRAAELDVHIAIDTLLNEGYIRIDSSVPLSGTNDSSCYYSVSGKEYIDDYI